jgi:hypothetical protein
MKQISKSSRLKKVVIGVVAATVLAACSASDGESSNTSSGPLLCTADEAKVWSVNCLLHSLPKPELK